MAKNLLLHFFKPTLYENPILPYDYKNWGGNHIWLAKPFVKMDRNPQWVVGLKRLNHKNIINGVLFNYNKPIEAMLYTNLTVYPGIPTQQTITDLTKRGYAVIINDSGNIPAELKIMKDVTIENLAIDTQMIK